MNVWEWFEANRSKICHIYNLLEIYFALIENGRTQMFNRYKCLTSKWLNPSTLSNIFNKSAKFDKYFFNISILVKKNFLTICPNFFPIWILMAVPQQHTQRPVDIWKKTNNQTNISDNTNATYRCRRSKVKYSNFMIDIVETLMEIVIDRTNPSHCLQMNNQLTNVNDLMIDWSFDFKLRMNERSR